MSRLTLLLFWASIVFSSATDKYLNPGLRGVGLSDIVDVAVADDDLSVLVELVTLAGLTDALNGPGPFTVFAPTNDAFSESIADLDDLESLDVDVVSALLTYHVVPGTYLASDITDGLTLTTLQGETIEFGVSDGVVTVNEEAISATDISATNGVIHKIDGVMYPRAILGPAPDTDEDSDTPGTSAPNTSDEDSNTPAPDTSDEDSNTPAPDTSDEDINTPAPDTSDEDSNTPGTLGEVADSDDDLSVLVELVTLAGLADALATAGPFTVFAPTNAAFEEAITDLDNLESLDVDVLTTYLTYHVVPGTYMASDITDGLILTTLQGETIEFGVDGDVVTVNEEVISATDIAASNGVIHKIDGAMYPKAFFEVSAPDQKARWHIFDR